MKFIAAVALLAFIITASFVITKCDETDCYFVKFMKKKATEQCYTEYPISKENINRVFSHRYVPGDHEVKCWISCVLKKLGVIQLIKMDWLRYKHIINHCIINQDGKVKVDKLIKICQAQVPQKETEECQLAYLVAVCEVMTRKKLGLPIADWNE